MGLLGDLFDDVVDIAATPARLVGKITDDVLETDLEEWVEDTTNSVKITKSCRYCKDGRTIPTGMMCNKCGRAR